MVPSHLVATATARRIAEAALALVTGDIDDPKALAALIEAVEVHRESVRRKKAEPLPVMPFGPKRGAALETLPTDELEKLERYVTSTLHNPAKAQFRASNLTLRAAVIAELDRRRSGKRAA